jgi:hypothetical protein
MKDTAATAMVTVATITITSPAASIFMAVGLSHGYHAVQRGIGPATSLVLNMGSMSR